MCQLISGSMGMDRRDRDRERQRTGDWNEFSDSAQRIQRERHEVWLAGIVRLYTYTWCVSAVDWLAPVSLESFARIHSEANDRASVCALVARVRRRQGMPTLWRSVVAYRAAACIVCVVSIVCVCMIHTNRIIQNYIWWDFFCLFSVAPECMRPSRVISRMCSATFVFACVNNLNFFSSNLSMSI